MNATAVVVGGGIGGFAVTGGLTRAGWQVTVLERADAFTEVGTGIVLAPNAVKSLDWLSLQAKLRALAMAQGMAVLRTSRGRWLVRSRVEVLRERYGVPAYGLHRADLLQLLVDAASDTDPRTGQRVTGIRQDGEQVTVQVDGQPSLTADLVVGADGIGSAIRLAVVAEHPEPAYAGYVTWRAVVNEAAATGAEVPAAVTESWGRAQRFGIVPLTDGRICWYATACGPAGTGVDEDLAAVASRLAGWHDPIPRLLAATGRRRCCGTTATTWPTRSPLRARSGRAARRRRARDHAGPRQGAALALEDAVVLTAAVTGTDDAAAALWEYHAARRPRTQQLVRASAQVGRVAQWSNRDARAIGDGLIWLIPTAALLRVTDDTRAPGSRRHGASRDRGRKRATRGVR